MDWPAILALAKSYTNSVALGQGAVPIPGPQGPPGADGASPTTYLGDVPGVVVNSTSEAFIASLFGKGLARGNRLIGVVAFSDLPSGVNNAELTFDIFEIGANSILYAAQLTSVDILPYLWTAASQYTDPIDWVARPTESSLAYKLDKVTSAGSERVYAVSADGQTQKTINVVGNAVDDYSLPIRNANGTFAIGEPENDNEPATKKYVDDNAGTDLTKGGTITGNLEINGNLILHGNETIDGNLLIGDVEVATRQFLLSVTPPRDAAERSGIIMHVVNNGAATYSFFSGMDTLTETITIPPLDQLVIADSGDFPELLWYQGDPLIEVGTVLTIDATGIVEQSVKVIVGYDAMAIMNFDAENPLVLNEGSVFMFNKVLLLGSPEDAQGAAIQAAQASTRTKGYSTCAGLLAEWRQKIEALRGGVNG